MRVADVGPPVAERDGFVRITGALQRAEGAQGHDVEAQLDVRVGGSGVEDGVVGADGDGPAGLGGCGDMRGEDEMEWVVGGIRGSAEGEGWA